MHRCSVVICLKMNNFFLDIYIFIYFFYFQGWTNGTVIAVKSNGTVIPVKSNGTVIPVKSNGTVMAVKSNG
jgi:hypothetical protein